jgi:hypothetical protein
VFAFTTECCSDSQRNGVRLHNGIAFAFDRIPHAEKMEENRVIILHGGNEYFPEALGGFIY